MALDGATLCIIKNQLNNEAVGARIEKITMPYKDRIIIALSKTGWSGKLLISCNPSSPRIHLTQEKYENPQTPPMICMLLRKRLVSGRLQGVRQAGMDRVLILDFECKNELGDDIVVSVVVEIMGRLSNIIVVKDEKIVDCVRRFDPEEGKRFMLPGAKYELPSAQDKINILTESPDDIINRLKTDNQPLNKALCAAIDGISPIIAREIAYLTLGDKEKSSNELNNYEYEKLSGKLIDLKNSILSDSKPQICVDSSGVPKDFTFIDITQYGSKFTFEKYDSIGEMLDDFYSKRDNAELMRRQSADMLKLLNNLSERSARKLHNRENELKATKSREKLRIYGELVKANIHAIKPGDSFVQCVNYYDENCAEIRVPLDIALSPAKNAQKYFNEYRKLSNAAGMLEDLINQAQKELEYIDSVFDSLCRADCAADVTQIREELILSGYIRQNNKSAKRQKLSKATPDKYISSDGFTVLLGRNNRQNDELTLHIAEKNDIWFHTKEIPGSHVIISTANKDVPESTLIQAATLAAKNSKAGASRQVPVDYTAVRYVKKPAGAKPGMVIYTTNKTIYANPLDSDILNGIKPVK